MHEIEECISIVPMIKEYLTICFAKLLWSFEQLLLKRSLMDAALSTLQLLTWSFNFGAIVKGSFLAKFNFDKFSSRLELYTKQKKKRNMYNSSN